MTGKRFVWILWIGIPLLLLLTLAGCAAGMEPEAETAVETVVVVQEGETVVETVVVEKEVEEVIDASPQATLAEEPMEEEPAATATKPPISPTPPASPAAPTSTPVIEPRIVEVEWPQSLHLGDSDVVRMAIIPTKGGYSITTEFPDHKTITQDVPVIRPEGYDLFGVGRLNGVGFTIAPSGEQARSLPLDESVVWHWSLTPLQPGKQRITVTLLLRWVPTAGLNGTVREAVAYSKGLEIRVRSFFGLTRRQTMTTGLFSALLGGVLSLFALIYRPTWIGRTAGTTASKLSTAEPNPEVVIECPADIQLTPGEQSLLRSLFSRYDRLILQSEFMSGYSGARTFLLLPIRPDGRSDAYTIAKIGDRTSIQREYQNYEVFVKHTLPPITARIQNQPLSVRGNPEAVLQVTFIGETGKQPTSLRQALLNTANPALLVRLFDIFGPNWWLQRSPYTFRMAEEYDRSLPPHYVLEPDAGRGFQLQRGASPANISLSIGDRVSLHDFTAAEPHRNEAGWDIRWENLPGQAELRIRWLGAELPKHPTGRVAATREDLMRSYTTGLDLKGLPDPLEHMTRLLEESLIGTRSIIHGDLNLENVLVGPGDFVWLIDFASTREGHPMADFAHLEAEIISHVIAPQAAANEYLDFIQSQARKAPDQGIRNRFSNDKEPLEDGSRSPLNLIQAVRDVAMKCLANPTQPREYHLALFFSCIGALKYQNLNPHQKHLLYLTAANLLASRGSNLG
jgi:hypothetical protein